LFFSGMFLTQFAYLYNTGKINRYRLHRDSLYSRYLINMSELTRAGKKPKIH